MLFAKAPIAGAVKTRLIPVLGAEAAAQLHRQLVVRVLETLIEANVGPVELCCAPDTAHPFFAECLKGQHHEAMWRELERLFTL